MYQLLSRNSFEASEFTIYKIIKAYYHIFDSPGKKEKIDKEILLKLVNFEKMTLMEVNLVVGDDWLPKGKYNYWWIKDFNHVNILQTYWPKLWEELLPEIWMDYNLQSSEGKKDSFMQNMEHPWTIELEN